MDSNIGKKLDGRYELLELIGVGGMAEIYRARDIREDRTVAVKILKTEFAGSDEFLRRFRNESKAIALLSHPNIVKIYDVGFTDKVQFIVMEYVDGITLTDYIEQQGVLKWNHAVHFTIQVLKALRHAHDRGIVHRDIKSSNIMLLSDGTIKVMDFGIARFNRENNNTVSDKTIGSVHYISPEQARGDLTDERSDIYSVGVALYEMLTGKKPFDGDTAVAIALKHMQTAPKRPTEINETIPEGLEQIVLKAMQKDPSARYQTAGEMITDLEEFKKNPGMVFDYKFDTNDKSLKTLAGMSPAAEPEKTRAPLKVGEYDEDYEDEEVDDSETDEDEDEYDDFDNERRSPIIPILFAVGAAIVVAAVFLILFVLSRNFSKSGSQSSSSSGTLNGVVIENGEFPMPQLIGMNWEEANKQYGDGALMTLVKQDEYSSEYEEGVIFEQSTVEGRMVKVGSQVIVKVSMGNKKIQIQDFRDRDFESVKRQLERDHLVVKVSSMESDEIDEGRVISTDPPADQFAEQGSTVVVYVSMGAAEKMKIVPKLEGMPLQEALNRCDEYNLVPKIEYEDSIEEKGKVLKQSVKPDEKVMPGTEITLTVSSGELPEKEYDWSFTLPQNISGDFQFKLYIDGELSNTKTVNVGLAASKTQVYKIKGQNGTQKTYTIIVRNTANGKEGTYIESNITFTSDAFQEQKVKTNSNVFKELADKPVSSSKPPQSSSKPSSSSSSTKPPQSSSSTQSSSSKPTPSSSSSSSSSSASSPASSSSAEPVENEPTERT